jgi:hypothetical protein
MILRRGVVYCYLKTHVDLTLGSTGFISPCLPWRFNSCRMKNLSYNLRADVLCLFTALRLVTNDFENSLSMIAIMLVPVLVPPAELFEYLYLIST